MVSFKLLYETQVAEDVFVKTFLLKKSDFAKFDLIPPKEGKGFLVTCTEPTLFNSLILMDGSEEKAKQSHDSTVTMVKKSIKKAQT